MKFTSIRSAATALCLVAATLHAADEPQILTPARSTFDAFAQFASVLDCLQKNYIDPSKIQTGAHTTVALREFVRSVDPEADLLTPEERAAFQQPAPDGTGDIGLSLVIRYDYPTVVAAYDGSPAQKAGLLTGELITALDAKPTTHARLFEITNQLRGAVGTKITLRVLDPKTGNAREVVVERTAGRPAPQSTLKFLASGIAYYRLAEFSAASVEKLQVETTRARIQKAAGLIVDIRNNPGGDLDAAVVAAKRFLPANAEIVTLDYRNPAGRATFVGDSGIQFTAPLVLLVNGGTAAEAEIFAAAVRDHKRARLVGTKTFGRGQHFALFPLPDGSGLYIPAANYLPPSRQKFHGSGLTPDFIVELAPDTDRLLAATGFGAFDWVSDKTQVLATDLPLAQALKLLAK